MGTSIDLAASAVTSVAQLLGQVLKMAQEDKRTYTEKMESATGDDVFKYVLLINVSSLDVYVTQTRLQADESFRLSRNVALVGFGLLVVGIALSVYLTARGGVTLQAAYLASIAGAVTEFIAGVFFYLYNRTLQQLNRFHDKLVAIQQVAMSFLANSLIADAGKRDDSRAELARRLVGTGMPLSSA